MTAELRPYPDYVDSCLPWLGAIPAHWEVRRNGRLFAQRNETGHGSLPILEVSLKTGVRVRDMENLARKQVMSDREKYKRAAKGDIAYNMMRMWQGAVGTAPVDGLVSPAYVVARPYPETDSRYFSYLFRTAAYMAEVDGYSRGIVKDRNRLYWDDFKRMPSCFPPTEEQNAIANYLDANAALVRKFISNRRQLIEVLNEQKQAIINGAVTCGLGQDIRLEPSSLEWLGGIPAHWHKRRLKYLVHNVNEQTGSKSADEIYVALEHVESWSGRLTLPSDEVVFDSQVKRFQPNDVLFGKLRPYLAKVTRAQVSGVCVGEFLVLRTVEPAILPEFLEQKLRSKQLIDLINSSTFGAKMPRADWTFIGNITIVYPPSHSEQREIIGRIAEQTANLSSAIERAQQEIELIREYRTRLIADVVTGKSDVRHLAPAAGAIEPENLEPTEDDEDFEDELTDGEEAGLVEETADVD